MIDLSRDRLSRETPISSRDSPTAERETEYGISLGKTKPFIIERQERDLEGTLSFI